MLSFKQYISESLDSPYEFTKNPQAQRVRRNHSYVFNDHNNRQFHVNIFHHEPEQENSNEHSAEIDFADEQGRMHTTGNSGKHASRILSTVGDIMVKHAKQNPNLTSYKFSSFSTTGGKDSKTKLYSLIAKKYGGSKVSTFDNFHVFEIPVKKEVK